MLTSPQVTAAFDLQPRAGAVRDGCMVRGHRGACYLVGRKLIEAGVRFVTVDVRWPLTRRDCRAASTSTGTTMT